MIKKLISRLHKKGWKREEILKVLDIIKEAKIKKHPHAKIMDNVVYWALLIVIITLNFGIAVAIIPSILSFNWPFLYFVLFVLGWVFGLMIETVVRSIENLETSHHVALSLIIPLVGVVNILLIGFAISPLKKALVGTTYVPYIAGFVYSFALLTPFLIFKFILKRGYYS